MYREITIGSVKVPMLANAATPLRYKHLFHKDIIKEFQEASGDISKVMDSIPELAFIMAKAAEAKEGKADMNLLNEDVFVDWLEQFDPLDLPMASEQIVDLYMGNSITDSEPKKKEKEKQSES